MGNQKKNGEIQIKTGSPEKMVKSRKNAEIQKKWGNLEKKW